MVPSIVVMKLMEWLWYHILPIPCHRAARRMRNCTKILQKNQSFKSLHVQSPFPSIKKCALEGRESQTLVCDILGALLRTDSFFPYFMFVAFEGGNIFRAFLLLLSCPVLWFLNFELQLRAMIFISFCGLRTKDMESVSRAVLPKFFLENLNPNAYEILSRARSKVIFTSVPRVMVEYFLKEYLSVDAVVGTELKTSGKRFTGLICPSGLLLKHRAVEEYFGEKKPDIGLGSSSLHDHPFLSFCKEAYLINKEEGKRSSGIQVLPREKFPKPVIFHDGRLAFLPTPMATLRMFIWLPLGIALAIFRLLLGICLPYKVAIPLGTFSGIRTRVELSTPKSPEKESRKGVLYVSSHRTLLDPVFLSTSLRRPLTAVTYSLSKVSEFLSPIRTVRLTRDRTRDGETMQRLLGEGDLVVCPEGTTCREPYLLRFSSLFAELADKIVPVAMDTHVTMFYGTTANGLKCLDPFFFLMNPRPSYYVHVLEELPRELTCAGGKSSHEVANYIQKQLAIVLGFECTSLTRKDKYLMLAGNEGIVRNNK
ncbi:hypothetical protein SAY86_025354 [Trapa natans]|uniref:Phospholipid/glycerol acyltransferase domain-containing protein n=1 Tax=Trapa natans TaxID=22666 RepID=A0AAN7M704_TRANT|nr:hypothetical protein SAY86_025354 [Trapa natans]